MNNFFHNVDMPVVFCGNTLFLTILALQKEDRDSIEFVKMNYYE